MTQAGTANPTPMDAEGQRLLARLGDWLPAGAPPAVLVTVWAVHGAAPREAGARLLCRGGRLLAGTIGGGHLEEQALKEASHFEEARSQSGDGEAPDPLPSEVREEGESMGSPTRLSRYALGSRLGQCCGGAVVLHYQIVTWETAPQLGQRLAAALQAGCAFESRFGDETLSEWPQPETAVLLFGGGHVGTALCRVLQPLPWRVIVVDQRPEWADRVRFPPGTEVICTEPLRLLAAWGWLGTLAQSSQMAQRLTAQGKPLPPPPSPGSTRALVMTHDHALDRDLTEALLRLPAGGHESGDRLAFVGLIGSKAKIAVTRQRLCQRGVGEALIATLQAPIGLRLGGRLLGDKSPGQIAISVAAQLLAAGAR